MTRYRFNGAVLSFDKVVLDSWTATTIASSEEQAKRNIIHQFKKKYGYSVKTKFDLHGTISRIYGV